MPPNPFRMRRPLGSPGSARDAAQAADASPAPSLHTAREDNTPSRSNSVNLGPRASSIRPRGFPHHDHDHFLLGETRGPGDPGNKGPGDQGTRGPRDHGTTGPRVKRPPSGAPVLRVLVSRHHTEPFQPEAV